MQHAGGVGGGERVGDAHADVAHLVGRERAPVAQPVGERAVRTQFQHHVRAAVGEDPRVVHGDHVRMAGQLARRGDLTHEAPLVTFGDQNPIVDLECHVAPHRDLAGAVDDPEAALPERLDDS